MLLRTQAFNKLRDEVLRLLDTAKMDAFFQKYKVPLPPVWASDKPNAQLACMHYARLQVNAMTEEEKLFSAKWLIENTYSLPSGFSIQEDKLVFVKPNNSKANFGMDGPSGTDLELATREGKLPYIFCTEFATSYQKTCKGDDAAIEQAEFDKDVVRVEMLDGLIIWERGSGRKS